MMNAMNDPQRVKSRSGKPGTFGGFKAIPKIVRKYPQDFAISKLANVFESQNATTEAIIILKSNL